MTGVPSIENAAREFVAAWNRAHSHETVNLSADVRIAAAKLREAVEEGERTLTANDPPTFVTLYDQGTPINEWVIASEMPVAVDLDANTLSFFITDDGVHCRWKEPGQPSVALIPEPTIDDECLCVLPDGRQLVFAFGSSRQIRTTQG